MPSPRITVLVRPGCHLCEVAVSVAEQVGAETGDEVAVINIDLDPELRRRYTDEVPVSFVDGVPHDYWRIDPDRLRDALKAVPPAAQPDRGRSSW